MSAVSKLAGAIARRFDSWSSSLTGFGTDRDKSTSLRSSRRYLIPDEELESLLDFDDMAEILVSAEPEAMFRQGFDVKINEVETDKRIKAEIARLEVAKAWTDALVSENTYGGAAIWIGINDGQEPNMPVALDRVESVDYLIAIDRRDVRPMAWDDDPFSPRFGRPVEYDILPTHRTAGMAGPRAGSPVRVHHSRLVVFEGLRCSPSVKRQRQGWGQAKLDRSHRALQIFHGNWSSITALIADASQAVFKIPNLWDILTSPESSHLTTRAELLDLTRSTAQAIMLDKEEDYERKDTTMSGLPDVLDRTAHRLAASARMPVAILMGREPSGLNATGESDIRNWYDNVAGKRTDRVEPQLRTLFDLVFRSKRGPTSGQIPESYEIHWPPMWQVSPVEASQIYATNTQADVALINAGVAAAPEIAVARFGPEGYRRELSLDVSHYEAELAALRTQVASGEGELPPSASTDTSALGDAIAKLRGAAP